MICYDDTPGGGRFVLSLTPPATFDPYYRDIATEAADFCSKYSKVPGEHTLDIINSLCARHADSTDIYQRIYQSLEQVKGTINRQYVVQQAQSFAKYQRIRRGVTDAVDALKKQDNEGIEEAERALRAALKSSIDLFDPGALLTDTKRSLQFLEEEHSAFNCGIKEIDYYQLGPARGILHVFGALPGYGKSWWLIHLAKQALLQGLNVSYITLEMSERSVCQRLMQSMFSISKREEVQRRQAFELDELGRFVSMDVDEIRGRPFLRDDGIRQHLVTKLRPWENRAKIWIKEFPMGSVGVSDIEAYLDGLEASKGFIPDIVCLDYADIMKINASNYRVELGATYRDLRGLAQKRNIGMATCTQFNREGASAKVITKKHASEDWSKSFTADVLITFNQSEEERQLGLARLFVDKGRSDVDHFTVLISQAYGIGQFVMDSAKMMPQAYWPLVEQQTNTDVEDHSH